MNARISIRKVLGFCCSAKVMRGAEKLYETRDYPFGFDANAYHDAQDWAEANRVELRPSDRKVQP